MSIILPAASIAILLLVLLAASLRRRATRPRQRPDTLDVLTQARVTDPNLWMKLR